MASKSNIAIRVRGLSKSYTIAQNAGEKHVTLAETLLARARRPFARSRKETFWALKEINFDIKKGDVVGIIGRNGAGKSTLLKILSRITEPTSGQIDLYGRVGSLLEVGTGFHPELTGRENIFLNGAILGMTKAEIKRQFDAIVDFAGVEQFLDTPVKRYSSGMYVRLAFAVAAHLNPEILVVDEVLAVGDAEFQSRCLGKMKEVSKSGRTVLFVSHNLAAVQNLCSVGILLERGNAQALTTATEAVQIFMERSRSFSTADRANLGRNRPAGMRPTITEINIIDQDDRPTTSVPAGADIRFEMKFHVASQPALRNPVMGLVLKHSHFGVVGGVNMLMTNTIMPGGPHTFGAIRCVLDGPPLLPGGYSIDMWLTDGLAPIDTLLDVLPLSLIHI